MPSVACTSTALWHLRVLAGWLPPGGSEVVRVLAGGYEITNVEAHVDELAGGPHPNRSSSGRWPRRGRVCARLGRSSECAPRSRRRRGAIRGPSERASLAAALRVGCARRISDRIPELRRWASAAAAVVVADERFGHGRELTSTAAIDARRLLGSGLGRHEPRFLRRRPGCRYTVGLRRRVRRA